MIALIVRRVLAALVVFIGVTLIVFSWTTILHPEMRSGLRHIMTEPRREEVVLRFYGYDQPVWAQYAEWLFGRKRMDAVTGEKIVWRGVMRGDLGWSISVGKPLIQAIREQFPRTLELILWSLPLMSTGAWFGMRVAQFRGGRFDRIMQAINRLGLSLPALVLSGLIIILALRANWFIVGEIPKWMASFYALEQLTCYTGLLTLDSLLNGRPDVFVFAMQHTLLPILALSFVGWMLLFKVAWSSALTAWQSDELIAARGRGLPDKLIVKEYVRPKVRDGLLSASRYLAFALLDSVLIIEAVFGYPGLGAGIAEAARQLDAMTLLGVLLFAATVILMVKLVVEVLRILFARQTRVTGYGRNWGKSRATDDRR